MTSTAVRLKHIANVRVSNVDKKTVEGELPVRLCNYTDVYYADTITDDRDFMIATATPQQVETFRLQPGQTIITKDSETADDIGVPAYVDVDAPDLICGYHLAQITPDRKYVDPRFLYWAVASRRARDQLSLGASGVTRFGLRTDTVTGLRLSLPGHAEQRRIANYLDSETARIDALIDAKQEMIDRGRERFRAWVGGAIFAGNALPLRRVVTELKTGATPAADEYDRLVGDHVPWYSPGDLDLGLRLASASRWLAAEAVQEGWVPRFSPGSVLVVGIGATAGRVAFLDHAASGNQQITALRPSELIEPRYLAWQLWARADELRALAPYTTLPILNNDYLKSVTVHVPDRATQQTVANAIDREQTRLDNLTGALTRQIELLRERRQSLITAAATGEIEVP